MISKVQQSYNFNPRSLAGATILLLQCFRLRYYFNPRSLAGATKAVRVSSNEFEISIHAPSRERRQQPGQGAESTCNFNPRSLAGATPSKSLAFLTFLFQSTLPRGSDRRQDMDRVTIWLFQSTLPRGSDAAVLDFTIPQGAFQSTLPRGSDSIKTNYFSIHLNQAFFAN